MEDHDQSGIHEAYASEMEDLWKNKIGCELFNGNTYKNVSGRQIKELMKSLSKTDATQFSYLVVVIIAKGGLMESRSGLGDIKPKSRLGRARKWWKSRNPTNRTWSPFIYGNDGKKVSEEKILSYFHNANSPWKDKPRFFILGYNRLSELAIRRRCSEAGPQYDVTQAMTTRNSPARTMTGTSNLRHPSISDFILLYGTSPKLIDVLYSVFSNNWQTKSVTGLLTMVNDRIRNAGGTARSLFESSVVQPLLLHHEGCPQEEVQNPAPEAVQPAKGYVLIISNVVRPNSQHHQADINMMESLWKGKLNCDLHRHQSHANQSANQIKDLLKEFSEIDTASYEYAVIVISSHGHLKKKRVGSGCRPTPLQPRVSHSHFVGIDDELINEREMLCLFNRDDSPWRGKDKIFILDYCRGNLADPGVPFERVVTDGLIIEYEPNEDIMPASISTMIEDSFLVYATHAGYIAYSDGLIRAVQYVFADNWRSKSVAEMLTQVNSSMKKSELPKKAMSVFKSTSTKDFYLFNSA